MFALGCGAGAFAGVAAAAAATAGAGAAAALAGAGAAAAVALAAGARSAGPRSGAAALLTTMTGFGGGSGLISATAGSLSSAGSTEGAARAVVVFCRLGAREVQGASFGERKKKRRKEKKKKPVEVDVGFFSAKKILGWRRQRLSTPSARKASINFLISMPIDVQSLFYACRAWNIDGEKPVSGPRLALEDLPACRRRQSFFSFPDFVFSPTTQGRAPKLNIAFAFNSRFPRHAPVATRSEMINTRFMVAIQTEEAGLEDNSRAGHGK